MKNVIRGAVVLAAAGLVLSLGLPAFAEDTPATGTAPTVNDQTAFAKTKEPNPLDDSGLRPGGMDGSGTGGTVVPEPATLALLGLGLATLGVARRRQKKG